MYGLDIGLGPVGDRFMVVEEHEYLIQAVEERKFVSGLWFSKLGQ